MRKHIITISGKPGSGKSTTADKLAELLGYSRYSSGDIVRKVLTKHKLTLAEYNKQAERDLSLDSTVDNELRAQREKRDIVIDSRLGFYWIPESFKIYLDLNMDVATARIFKDSARNITRSSTGEGVSSLTAVTTQVKKRIESEQNRFQNLYHIDPYDLEHFDLIIDTSRHTPQTVALEIFNTYSRWLTTEAWTQEKSALPIGYSIKSK